MDDTTDIIPDESPEHIADGYTNDRSDVRARVKSVFRRISEPKSQNNRRKLKNITIQDRRGRLINVEQCVKLGMAVEQIVDFLPTLGLKLSRSTVYEYLSSMKLPRGYKRAEGDQSHHDYYTFRFFIRIAHDAARAGFQTKRLVKGSVPWEGVRFRPDFKFEIRHYVQFMEMQLSDLAETRWTVKFANYWRLRQMGWKFRVLFIIDQHGDLAYIRRHAREFLERRKSDANLFLFAPLETLRGPANVATDPVWMTPWGEKAAMLEWLKPSEG